VDTRRETAASLNGMGDVVVLEEAD
jgi:hypothetical protein